MSLILEALKKSEAQRRLGEAPGLGTPITATRRRRSPLPWLILVVIAALCGGGWWLFSRAPAPAPQTASTAASPPAKPARPRPTSSNVTAMTPPDSDHRDRHPAEAVRPSAAPPTMTAAPPSNPVRTSTAQPPSVPTRDAALAPTATTPAAAAPAAIAPPIAAAVLPPRPDPALAPVPAAPAVAPPPPPPPAGPTYADVQNIEDLPYSVRKDIPDLPISMQVYSPDPARRFVIVNGNRKGEGETVKDGVALREIRPNGVVLEFRGQRFFVSRPGS
jgi:general secretion pathway protein B